MKKSIEIMCLVILFLYLFQTSFVLSDSNSINEEKPLEKSRMNIIEVGPGQMYTNIQAAIDNASSGDTINVNMGVYKERIVVDKQISIIGEDHSNTILDGVSTGVVVTILADWVNFSGFKINDNVVDKMDIGIKLNNVRFCNISNNIIQNKTIGIFINTLTKNEDNDYYIDVGFNYNSSSKRWDYNFSIADGNFTPGIVNETLGKRVGGDVIIRDDGQRSGTWDSGDTIIRDPLNEGDPPYNFDDQIMNYYQNPGTPGRIDFKPLINEEKSHTYTESLIEWADDDGDWKIHDNDIGMDSLPNTSDLGEGDRRPTPGEPNVDEDTDINISKIPAKNLITKNILKNERDSMGSTYGIYLLNTYENIIKENVFEQNFLGANIITSYNNYIYHNNFINNTISLQRQAYCDSNNYWNLSYSLGGNYWSDWISPDIYIGENQDVYDPSGDGIVDDPYVLEGPVNYKDFYPLTDPVIIHKKPVNYPPVADAGPDQIVLVNDTVDFDGNDSFDPDGDRLTYNWYFGDGFENFTGWRNSSNSSHIYSHAGNYIVRLFVSDGILTANDTCNILVKEIKHYKPIIKPTFPMTLRLDEDFGEFLYNLTDHEFHTDPNYTGDDLLWYVTGNSDTLFHLTGGNNTGINADSFSFISLLNRNGEENLTYHLYDPIGLEATIEQTVIVEPINDKPVAILFSDQSVLTNQNISFNGSSSYDIENDSLMYHWDFGDGNLTNWTFEKTILHTYTTSGNFTVKLTVSDGFLEDTDQHNITVLKNMSGRPNILPSFPAEIELYEDFGIYNQKLSDFEFHNDSKFFGDDLKWYVTGNSGTIFNIVGDNSTGDYGDTFILISIQDQFGTEIVTFHLHDPLGNMVSIEQTIIVHPVNDAPKIAELPDQSITENELLVLDVVEYISDVDNNINELLITINDSININLDGFVLYIKYEKYGNYNVSIKVSDGELTDQSNLIIMVSEDIELHKEKKENVIDLFQVIIIIIFIILVILISSIILLFKRKNLKVETKPPPEEQLEE